MKIDGLDEFIDKLEKASNGGFKEQVKLWMEAIGMDFLGLIREEIIRTKTVRTRDLLNSFHKDNTNNAWITSEGGLSLEVGTNLEYASFVNDGHFTIDPSKNQDRRWVPGRWKGDEFVYDPSSDTGMLLKFTWVEGTQYFDNALAITERIMAKSLEKKFQQWLDEYF